MGKEESGRRLLSHSLYLPCITTVFPSRPGLASFPGFPHFSSVWVQYNTWKQNCSLILNANRRTKNGRGLGTGLDLGVCIFFLILFGGSARELVTWTLVDGLGQPSVLQLH